MCFLNKILFKALHCAASRGHFESVKVLLETCQCPVDSLDINLCTPLFYAVTLGHLEIIKLLISHHADVTLQDGKGRTLVFSFNKLFEIKLN